MRRRRTIEEAAEAQVRFARVLDDWDSRLRFAEEMARRYGAIAQTYATIRDSVYARGGGRGERWSATYALRQAQRHRDEYAAIHAALRAGKEETNVGR